MTLKFSMQHRVLEYYQVCSMKVDLDLFYDKVKVGPLCFLREKGKPMGFSETIAVYDIKAGSCIQLNEYMTLYEYQRSRSFTDLRRRSLRFNMFSTVFP